VLICPVCEEPLTRTETGLRCPNSHQFDRAREGYVHLVGSRHPGDTRPMLRARRAFLERGHYRPLADLLETLAVAHVGSPSMRIDVRTPAAGGAGGVSEPVALGVLEVGCGEGYYIGGLRRALAAGLPNGSACLGLDVSKEAVRLAARRYPDVTFVVADIKARLPIASGSIGLLLDVFAPRNPAEFARIVGPGGLLLVAIPAAAHLAELRAALPLLGIEPEKERHVAEQLSPAFTLRDAYSLEYPMRLASADIVDLLTMTPSAHHLSKEAIDAARGLAPLAVTAAFRVLAFSRA
jgi:23S rRNA (guanine745-N1)-methyltransferase